jgi:HD-GYP domain-containing protein (c-di-GMP phosphodiesterase class II)
VAALAAAIGPETGLSGEELRLLDLAATVHDIGKIVVPPEFLGKPTRLSPAEFAVIKQHCDACPSLFREQAFGFVQEAELSGPARAP